MHIPERALIKWLAKHPEKVERYIQFFKKFDRPIKLLLALGWGAVYLPILFGWWNDSVKNGLKIYVLCLILALIVTLPYAFFLAVPVGIEHDRKQQRGDIP